LSIIGVGLSLGSLGAFESSFQGLAIYRWELAGNGAEIRLVDIMAGLKCQLHLHFIVVIEFGYGVVV
jgi:hypothetical protein